MVYLLACWNWLFKWNLFCFNSVYNSQKANVFIRINNKYLQMKVWYNCNLFVYKIYHINLFLITSYKACYTLDLWILLFLGCTKGAEGSERNILRKRSVNKAKSFTFDECPDMQFTLFSNAKIAKNRVDSS